MRKDMADVIIECTRHKGHGYGKDTKRSPHIKAKSVDEDAPRSAKMKPRGDENKHQTDRLQPLERFLRSHVGHLWDKVWAEICEANKYGRGDVRKQHLRRHVFDLVEVSPEPHYRWGFRFRPFYVAKGVLRETPPRKRRPSKVRTPTEWDVASIKWVDTSRMILLYSRAYWMVTVRHVPISVPKRPKGWTGPAMFTRDPVIGAQVRDDRAEKGLPRSMPSRISQVFGEPLSPKDVFGFQYHQRKVYYGDPELFGAVRRRMAPDEIKKYGLVEIQD